MRGPSWGGSLRTKDSYVLEMDQTGCQCLVPARAGTEARGDMADFWKLSRVDILGPGTPQPLKMPGSGPY